MACASCRSSKRDTGKSRKKGWSVDRQDERGKWCRVTFLLEGKKETSCSDKNLFSWWLQCALVYLLLRLCACAFVARFICLYLAAPLGEKQAGWRLGLAVYQAIVPSCLIMLWDIMQLSSLYFWAAELSASATLMVMWWIGIQERSLSLSLSASGYWPSQAQLSSLTLLSESITACSELQGSSERSTSRLSGTFFDLVYSGSISAAAMLKSMLILSKQLRTRPLNVNSKAELKL